MVDKPEISGNEYKVYWCYFILNIEISKQKNRVFVANSLYFCGLNCQKYNNVSFKKSRFLHAWLQAQL